MSRDKVLTVNSLIVKVQKSGEKYTDTGLVIVEEEKAVNFGEVVALPFLITESHKEYEELVKHLSVGDTVIFNAKMTYNIVKLENQKPNEEFLIMSLDNIHAIIKKKEAQ